MTRGSRRLVLLVTIVVSLLVACTTRAGNAPSQVQPVPSPGPGEIRTVPLQVLQASSGPTLAMVPVTISGRGPYLFTLDTGASASVVDTQVADELGLPRTGRQSDVTGVVGQQRVDQVRLDQWQVGDIALAPAEVAVLDLPSPEQGGGGLQGLLGSDVLSSFEYVVIDYDDRRLGLAGA